MAYWCMITYDHTAVGLSREALKIDIHCKNSTLCNKRGELDLLSMRMRVRVPESMRIRLCVCMNVRVRLRNPLYN